MTTAERLVAAGLILGEGPIRLDSDRYACVDIRQQKIYGGNLGGEFIQLFHSEEPISAICLLDDGNVLMAKRTGIETLDRAHQSITLPPTAPDIRLNDGKADPAGRFVAGSMADPPRAGAGTLWSFGRNSTVPLLDDLTIPNGLCWSAGAELLYFIDTPTKRIDAFDYDLETGTIHNRRTAVTIGEGLGSPDGMTIDSDGGLWVAMWGGGSVLRFHDGKLDARVDVPTPYVTCPAFVGSDCDTLLITTASEPNRNIPGAGDIYLANVGTSGMPTTTACSQLLFDDVGQAPSTSSAATG